MRLRFLHPFTQYTKAQKHFEFNSIANHKQLQNDSVDNAVVAELEEIRPASNLKFSFAIYENTTFIPRIKN